MANTATLSRRSSKAAFKTLSLDEQVQDFMEARDGLRLFDAIYGNSADKLLPLNLGKLTKSKRA